MPNVTVRGLVTCRAEHHRHTESGRPADDEWLVRSHRIALRGSIAIRMAIQAAWARDDFARLTEERERSHPLVCDAGERRRGLERRVSFDPRRLRR
jgi:hypothetical protein